MVSMSTSFLSCSTEMSENVRHELFITAVLYIILAITAIVGNSLILLSLKDVSTLYPTTKLLFSSLAITDLCVGIVAEPVTAVHVYLISTVKKRWKLCMYMGQASLMTSYCLCAASLITMTLISLDRLLALLLGMRYRHVVSTKRIKLAIILSWFVSIAIPIVYIWNFHLSLWFALTGIIVCSVSIFGNYSKILLTLRRNNQRQTQGHIDHGLPSQRVALRIARYRRTVLSVLWVQLALAVCYVPHFTILVMLNLFPDSPSLKVAVFNTSTLVFLNSSLNPILYCWKIKEVRTSVRNTIRQLFAS